MVRCPSSAGRIPTTRFSLCIAPCLAFIPTVGWGRSRAKGKVKAILSDVHGNLEALRAVLDDISRQHVHDIYNLGDITGYGPNPIECIDLSMEMALVLTGQFDQAALRDPFSFPAYAEKCVLWTRHLLNPTGNDGGAARRRVDFLKRLDSSRRDEQALYVHGSPRNPLNEYVFAEDIHNPSKMARISATFEG